MEHLERAGRAAARLFRTRFGRPAAAVAAAPGRVNLVGEHVDHVGGPVLPVAIDRAAAVAVGPGAAGAAGRVRAVSRELGAASWDVDGPPTGSPPPTWARALATTAARLDPGAVARGLDVAVASDVPPGGGCSSSAAVLVAARLALEPGAAPGPPGDPHAVAAFARHIEHEVLGVPCGPMDQLAALLGGAGHALHLDCRTLAASRVPLPPRGLHLAFVDTGVRHELADGRYAARRAELDRAAAALGVDDWAAAARRGMRVPAGARDAPSRRAAHVLSEIRRTDAAAAALRRGDAAAFGRALDASHVSLRDHFDASVPRVEAVRTIVRHALGDELLGARMVGGGWGGGILLATRRPVAAARLATVVRRATAATGRRATALPVVASDGARRLEPARLA